MVGMELVEDRTTKVPAKVATSAVIAACLDRGLRILKPGVYENVIRVLVPLMISDGDLDRGLEILTEAVAAAD